MLVSKSWKILYGKMTKVVQSMTPRGQKYQREVMIGQSLHKIELPRGSLQMEWLKYKVSPHCNCSKKAKNYLYDILLGQEQKN